MSQPHCKIPCAECGELYTARGMSRHVRKPTCVTNQERKRRGNAGPASQSTSTSPEQLSALKPFHEVLQQLRASTKVLRRIPKGAQILAATSLTEKIEDVVEKKSESSWRSLMVFSFAGLKQPVKENNKKRNLTTAVKNNFSKQELNIEPADKQSAKKQPKEAVIKKLVEGKINDGDVSGALRVPSSKDSVAASTPEVLGIFGQ
ncbi:hypothetical protein RvY_16746 [Ramazzottius varieornatus]|uniref:Uncharacterized protein n=1 Tax=Ramazzottius varieornatus TaxID=947166 RepID=A0A1D1VZM3_RAMVA|nr:hypothetical protein RvY_16746 [Ramazzottius varieornatus]